MHPEIGESVSFPAKFSPSDFLEFFAERRQYLALRPPEAARRKGDDVRLFCHGYEHTFHTNLQF